MPSDPQTTLPARYNLEFHRNTRVWPYGDGWKEEFTGTKEELKAHLAKHLAGGHQVWSIQNLSEPETPDYTSPNVLRELAEWPRDYPEDGDALNAAAAEIERLRGWLSYIEGNHADHRGCAREALSGASLPESYTP